MKSTVKVLREEWSNDYVIIETDSDDTAINLKFVSGQEVTSLYFAANDKATLKASLKRCDALSGVLNKVYSFLEGQNPKR